MFLLFFFFSSRRRHTRSYGDWSSDVCSSDLSVPEIGFDVDFYDLPVLGSYRNRFLERIGFLSSTKNAPRVHRPSRSEERRVGKECRSRMSPNNCKEQRKGE